MKKQGLGTGISFKMHHLEEIQKSEFSIDWFELLTEDFLVPSRRISYVLDFLKANYPLVLHGVTLGIGSSEPLDFEYLAKVKKLADKINAPWISDHICWGQVPGAHFHELLPLPYTKEVADYVIERAKIVQDYLERPFALENISSYVKAEEKQMEEGAFCSYIIEESKTHMILDVNNIHVIAHNLGVNPKEYMKVLPWDRVIEIHLAGFSVDGDWFLDSHDRAVSDTVWELYQEAFVKANQPATLVEYEGSAQSFEEICVEITKAKEKQLESLYATTCCSL